MMTLTEFLLARIAEDEAVARAAAEETREEIWHARNYDCEGIGVLPGLDDGPEVYEIGPIDGRTPPMAAVHCRDEVTDQITRWSPARVLAECEAKRRIVESFSGNLHERWDDGFEAEKVGRDVLGYLALPYADHPDYREEWKP